MSDILERLAEKHAKLDIAYYGHIPMLGQEQRLKRAILAALKELVGEATGKITPMHGEEESEISRERRQEYKG
jgi:hypothetical protein